MTESKSPYPSTMPTDAPEAEPTPLRPIWYIMGGLALLLGIGMGIFMALLALQ